MPWIPAGGVKIMAPEGANYPVGKANPFYEGAFEQLTAEGAQQSDPSYLSHESVGLTMGWGNYYEPAGYYPGLQSRGAVRSGLLNDEQVWTFDTTSDPNFDPQNPNMTPWKDGVGMLYVMIYCDDHDGPVYFLGRFFRQEPGTT